jgi:osmotically-inducible protein OsmY
MRKTSLAATVAWLVVAAGSITIAAQLPDQQLGERVAATIRSYVQYTIFDHVDLNVLDGRVTLTGRVTHQLKKDEIGARVPKVQGVREIVNKIGVLPLSTIDQDLRMRISEAIYNHPQFWHYGQMSRPPIHIIVDRGQVTLEGVVSTEVDRNLANSRARVAGSLEVINNLSLDAKPRR